MDGNTFYYVTPLGTDFLSPSLKDGEFDAFEWLIDSLFNFAKKARSTLKIVIESNFHVYAFAADTQTNLHIEILKLFVEVRVRFSIQFHSKAILPNMVAMLITRNSIVKALRYGITADQICSFLEEYSENDIRMKEADIKLEKTNPGLQMNGRASDLNVRNEEGQYYKIPMNVVDQIYLWERETKRLRFQKAFLYRELESDVFSKVRVGDMM